MIKTPSNNSDEIYMIVEIGYGSQLIFSMEDGLHFINAYMRGKECKKEYKKPIEIFEMPKKLSLDFISKKEVVTAAFQLTVEGRDG